jgi:hypothetical protein
MYSEALCDSSIRNPLAEEGSALSCLTGTRMFPERPSDHRNSSKAGTKYMLISRFEKFTTGTVDNSFVTVYSRSLCRIPASLQADFLMQPVT